MQRWYKNRGGFALPTVLIASMVMLSILTVSVTSVATVRNNLKTQYYSQLAKVAGEAGTAYAQACLAKNGNVPQWSDASPLRPNTDCTGTPLSTLTCPGSAGCYVLSTATYRSSFSVAMPTLDAQGKAMTIPNKGFVELLRASTGEVWRTYYQPAAQPAVVPDLCSGEATSALGWSNAVISSAENQISISGATAAAAISTASGLIPAGPMYFQRNFNVSSSGTYTVRVQTKSSKDAAEIYMDGTKLTTSNGALASTTATLSVGCHTISVRLTNKSVAASYSQFAAAVTKVGATAPVVTTDTAWRVSAGASTSFSSSDYYADPTVWQAVVSYTTKPHAKQYTNWVSTAPDSFAAMIAPPGNSCSTSCPGGSYAYLRDSSDFYLSATTSVTVSTICDDQCSAYVDGTLIHRNNSSSSTVVKTTVSLGAGYHHFGIILYNGSTAANPSGVAGVVANASSGLVYSRTSSTWLGSTTWATGTTDVNIFSYAANYSPSPDNFIDTPTVDLLVVGGGGGGGANAAGGGGGGGVRYLKDVALSTGTYTVTIGAGGAKAASNSVVGSNGGQSVFGSYISLGGGGGASRDGGTAATSGGSGGGGAGAKVSTQVPGAAGTSGQGNAGGAGVTADGSTNATGGGGGGAGNRGFAGASGGSAGDGGAGGVFYFGTTRYGVAGGGAGGVTVNGTKGSATDGGGAGGAKSATATAATANTGGGGGGGGASGGAGGSGLVIVCFETGSMTVSATGTYSTSTATINGIGYTFYKFTASGTFTISTLKAS